MLRTGYYGEVSGPGLPATKGAEATHTMNLGLRVTFAIIAIVSAVGIVFDLRRLLRKPPQRGRPTQASFAWVGVFVSIESALSESTIDS